MNDNFTDKAKLLIIFINEEKYRDVLSMIKDAGIPGCTKIAAQNWFDPNTQDICEQKLLFSLVKSTDEIIRSLKFNAQVDPEIQGTILELNATNINANLNCNSQNDNENLNRSTDMNNTMDLIVSIVTSGHTEDLMAVAREAGARGGTVVDAHGTGTEEDRKFFGISLAPEKEMLFILANKECSSGIINAINNQPIFQEPGGGIIFKMEAEKAEFLNS